MSASVAKATFDSRRKIDVTPIGSISSHHGEETLAPLMPAIITIVPMSTDRHARKRMS